MFLWLTESILVLTTENVNLLQERADYLKTVASLKQELHATKADNWKLEKELLETLQRKAQLSEQVEQWQASITSHTYY